MASCHQVQQEVSHVLLGQADAETARVVREHVLACPVCRAAWNESEAVLRLMRQDAARTPSSSFRVGLARRLDRERRDEDALVHGAGPIDRAMAGAAFVRFRLRQSVALRVVLAAAAVHLIALGAWWWFDRSAVAPAVPEDSVAMAPPGPEDPAPTAVPDPAGAAEVATPAARDPAEPDPGDYIEAGAEPRVAVGEPELPAVLAPRFERELEEALARDNLFAQARYHMRLRFNPEGRGISGRDRSDADKAALRGMRFLVEQQEEDGSWNPGHFGGDPFARVGVTGLCVVALSVDAGIPDSVQRQTLTKGLDYLRSTMDRSTMTFGGVVRGVAQAGDLTLFNHAMATLALAEHYVLEDRTDEALLDEALLRLDDLGRQRLHRDLDREDTTTAPWVALALETARASGVRPPVLDLAGAASDARSYVANQVPKEDPDDEHLWAAVTVSGIDPLFDGQRSDDVWLPPLSRLLPHLRHPGLREPTKIFFASLDFHERGGVDWETWQSECRRRLLEDQRKDGSWGSEYTWDRVQDAGGELYVTALTVMTLSVPYRHAR